MRLSPGINDLPFKVYPGYALYAIKRSFCYTIVRKGEADLVQFGELLSWIPVKERSG
jgi:hypothetical protein